MEEEDAPESNAADEDGALTLGQVFQKQLWYMEVRTVLPTPFIRLSRRYVVHEGENCATYTIYKAISTLCGTWR